MPVVLKADLLANLHNYVTDETHHLYAALAVLAEAEPESAAFTEALTVCNHYVQTLQTTAHDVELKGLTAVCEAIEQRLLAIALVDTLEERQQLCAHLERLPRLVSNYLHAPIETTPFQKLVQTLFALPTPFDIPNQADELTTLFAEDVELFKTILSNNAEEIIEENTVAVLSPEVETVLESAQLDGNKSLDSLEEEILVDSSEIDETQDIGSSIQAKDLAIVNELENINHLLEDTPEDLIPKIIESDADVLEYSDFSEMHLLEEEDDSVLVSAKLDNLTEDEIIRDISQSESTAEKKEIALVRVSDDELETSSATEENTTSSDALLALSQLADDTLLDNEILITSPISLETIQEEESEFNDELTETADFKALEEIEPLDEMTSSSVSFDKLTTELHEFSELENTELSSPIALYSNTELSKNLDDELLEDEAHFTANAPEEHEKTELVDLADNVHEEEAEEEFSTLEELPPEVLDNWLKPHLEDADANTPEPIKTAENAAETVRLTQDKDAILPAVTEGNAQTTVQLAPPPIKRTQMALTPANNPTMAHFERLSNKIVELGDELTAALKQFVTTDEDSEEFLNSVETYTNIMQILWESAEQDNFKGLQNVYTFINENFFELSSRSQAERFLVYEQFAHFPRLVLEYLQTPKTGSIALIEHLQQPQWVLPLSDFDAKQLLSQLNQDATLSSIAINYIETTHLSDTIKQQTALFEEETEVQEHHFHLAQVENDAPDIFVLSDDSHHTEDDEILEAETEAISSEALAELEQLPTAIVITDNNEFEEETSEVNAPFTLENTTLEESFDSLEELESLSQVSIANVELQAVIDDENPYSESLETEETVEESLNLVEEDEGEIQPLNALDTLEEKGLEVTETDGFAEEESLENVELSDDISALVATNGDLEEIAESTYADFDHETMEVGEAKWQLAEIDILENLIHEINEAHADMYNAVQHFVTAEDNSDELFEAVEQYTDNLQSINEASEQAGLEGLQAVCGFVNDNIFELSTQGLAIRRAAQPALMEWLTQVRAYLINPLENAPQLVMQLCQPAWLQPLDEQQAADLLNILTLGKLSAAAPLDTAIETQAAEENYSEFSEAHSLDDAFALENAASFETDEADSLQEEDVLFDVRDEEKLENEADADLSTELSETEDTINHEHANVALVSPDILEVLVAQLGDSSLALAGTVASIVAAPDDSEELMMAVGTYQEQVQEIWDAAEMAHLVGVQEVCNFVNENIMLFGGLDQSSRETHQALYTDWIEWIIDYLQSPTTGAIALVAGLQNNQWLSPLEDERASELMAQLSAVPAETSPAVNEVLTEFEETATNTEQNSLETIQLASPDVLELVIAQLGDTSLELAGTVMSIVAAELGSEELMMAVGTYQEQVQAIWDAAEMAQLTGVQQVCDFVNNNVMLYGEQADRATTQALYSDWTQWVIDYLQTPTEAAPQLVQQLQDNQWQQPLSAEQTTELLTLLLPRAAAPALDSAAVAHRDPEETEPHLGAEDLIELVRNQLNDISTGLSAALEECVSMDSENPALLEAIESYTNQVQAILETAEMAGLQGLQEVCAFVSENIVALAMLDAEAKQTAKEYFQRWPQAALTYLSKPRIGAHKLVNLMQESGWPQPIDETRSKEMLRVLLQSSVSDQQHSELNAQILHEKAMQMGITPSADGEFVPMDFSDVGEITIGTPDVVEILTTEVEGAKEDLTTLATKLCTLKNQDGAFGEAKENYLDITQRLQMACEMVGLIGLQELCNFIGDNVRAIAERDLPERQTVQAHLCAWPDLLLTYLTTPVQGIGPLINHFRNPIYPASLSDEQAAVLAQFLAQGGSTSEDDSPAHQRQTVANPEDVSLAIPEDINRELLDAYLQETPQQSEDFSGCIQTLIQDPLNLEEITRAQRIAHTLKGSSNIIGIRGIANVAHHLEDTLEYLAQKRVQPPKELLDMMVEAADCIQGMVDALTGEDDPPPNMVHVLQLTLDWANQIDKGKLVAPVASARAAGDATAVAPAPKPAKEKKEKAEAAPEGGAAAAGSPEQFLRVPTRTIDELMRLVGELSIMSGQIQEKLRSVMGSTRLLTDQGGILQHKTFELENLVDVRGITGVENRYHQTEMDEEDFDPLEFEEYNELHSVAHSFIESINDSRELASNVRSDLVELETMFIQQERLNKEFQNTIMTTRMVPVATIVQKLQRNVRQTCRMTGKQAELEVLGTDIMIDSDVLDKLGDPLMHLIRNSIDHGIENADERVIIGKQAAGTLTIRFYREGNNIVVNCKDDGGGLNYSNIRYTAIQRGLITETQELTEPELARLILMPGFSTKSGVTQVSGRGVGMDVVHTNIREMKGTLDIFSETGKGTSMIIKLPMSLVTVHVLLVRIGSQRFGIPTNTLEQVLAAGISEFHTIGDEVTLKMGKNMYTLKALSDLLGVNSEIPSIQNYEHRPIMLVHEETGITAVVVDELLDTHDLVMKTMGKYVKNIHGVMGASILGDGNLVPLLDLPQLLRTPMQAAMTAYNLAQGVNPAAPAGRAAMPTVMIVDDSLSVRKSLSLLVEDAGFETLLAKDGVEAIEIMNQRTPDVMLVDMEMPRMNGLELTSHVRANPATQKLPVFMITSRTTEKHREQARSAGVSAYLTKPYQDTELLGLIDRALAGQI